MCKDKYNINYNMIMRGCLTLGLFREVVSRNCEIRDSGFGIRDAGCGMRGTGYDVRVVVIKLLSF